MMLLVLVFGVSAGFAADAEDGFQATDESAETVSVTNMQNTTLADSGSDELSENLGVSNDESYGSSNNDVLTANPDGSFTDLYDKVKNGGTVILDRNYVYTESKDSDYINGVVIDKSITINGNGFTLNGNNIARILNITSSNVILNNVKFINGLSSVGGGAIYWAGDGGVVNNCNFDSNIVTNPTNFQGGGALYWIGNNGKITGSSFSNNKATKNGGAIHWSGNNGLIKTSTFTKNEGNSSDYTGGAVFWAVGANDGEINNCRFIENSAPANGGDGAALGIRGERFTVLDSYFSKNYAKGESTIITTAPYTIIKNSKFEHNNATGVGGAIYYNAAATYGEVNNCTFINNTATSNGGAIAWLGNHGSITDSIFEKNNANDGGAISSTNQATYTSISNCEFNDNYAKVRGGAIYWLGSNSEVSDCKFENNEANSNIYGGGAIHWEGAYGTLSNSTFKSNHADAIRSDNLEGGDGGAVEWYAGYGKIDSCEFIDNTCADIGGAIFLQNTATGTSIENSKFTHNSAQNVNSNRGGGALYFNSQYCSCINSTFENNEGKFGGAIHVQTNYNTISECTFTNNKANSTNGGAIFVRGTENTVTDSSFTGNNANGEGGAVYVDGVKSIHVEGNTYSNNHATQSNDISANNATFTSQVLYIAPTAKGKKDGSDANNAANWTYAYSHVANGGTIYFTQGTYTDIVNQAVAKSLNLIGLGTVTIDLQQNGRAFTISSAYTTVDNINFNNGKVGDSGGAIYWSGAYATLKNSEFYNNTATVNGGAIQFTSNIKINIYDSEFNFNFAGRGGAIRFDGAYDATINNITAYNNGAIYYGGCFYFGYSGSAIVVNSDFRNNYVGKENVYIGDSGVFDLPSTGNFHFENDTFINNSALGSGGVARPTTGNTEFVNSKFINNSAELYGGALRIIGKNTYIENCLFEGNKAENGSAISVNSGYTLNVTNSNFVNNVASNEGTVYLSNNSVIIAFDNNELIGNDPGVGKDVNTQGDVTSDLFFIRQGATGTGLIETDPTNWTYAINHINKGGKIVFLQDTYSDLINLSKNRLIKVIL